MIEKLSFIRKDYDLDNAMWANVEYVQKVYVETLGEYPMVNLGGLVFCGGVITTVLSTVCFLENPACIIEQIAGCLACSAGVSVILFSNGQFENYIKNKEARVRLKKYGIKKPIEGKRKNVEKEF